MRRGTASDRYRHHGDLAMAETTKNLASALGVSFTIRRWTSDDCLTAQRSWANAESFDWYRIYANYRPEPSALGCALERDGELVALFVMDLSPGAVRLKFVERNTGTNTLKGMVTIAALDVATNYCQCTGRSRIRLQPKNDILAQFYENIGFTVDGTARDGWMEKIATKPVR